MTTNESPAAWLAALAPGDEVVVRSRDEVTIHRVSRVTRTRVYLRLSERYEADYRRSDGYKVGSDAWNRSTIGPVTPEHRAMFHRRTLVRKIENVAWAALPTATLERIAALVEVTRG